MESLIFLLVMNFMVIFTVEIVLDIVFKFKPFGVLLSIVSVRRLFSETMMSIDNKTLELRYNPQFLPSHSMEGISQVRSTVVANRRPIFQY